jgi:6-phosphogluconolactonase
MKHQNIHVFPDEKWPGMSASIINNAVSAVCKEKGGCSIMLTGGRSAERMYYEWADLLLANSSLSFYFGDERCVSPDDPESNYGLVMRSLFTSGLPNQYKMQRVHGEAGDIEAEAGRYDLLLPKVINVLLLSMGEDAHIASIFPADTSIHKKNHRVAVVTGPKPPNPRITITPKFIARAEKIFCLVTGSLKSAALANVFQDKGDAISIPAKLVSNGNWLIDSSAAKSIEKELIVKKSNL